MSKKTLDPSRRTYTAIVRRYGATLTDLPRKQIYQWNETIVLSSVRDAETNRLMTDELVFKAGAAFDSLRAETGDTIEFSAKDPNYYAPRKLIFRLERPTNLRIVSSNPELFPGETARTYGSGVAYEQERNAENSSDRFIWMESGNNIALREINNRNAERENTTPIPIYIAAVESSSVNSPGGWGLLIDAPGKCIEMGVALYKVTARRAELLALIEALDWVLRNKEISIIYSNTEYVVAGVNQWMNSWQRRGWKLKSGEQLKNSDLWEQIFHLYENLRNLVEVKLLEEENPAIAVAEYFKSSKLTAVQYVTKPPRRVQLSLPLSAN